MVSLKVHPDHRYLMYADGTPFFYLGDTAWEIFHRLTREEAEFFLGNRAKKGFTVIQSVVLAEFNGLHIPNAYGDCPLFDDDPTRPNEAYFAHVDFVVETAAKLGLIIGMLPTWGDKVGPVSWGVGPEVFTPENARVYGEFLGRRYKDAPIIWIIGGDRPVETETQLLTWRAMAEGIKAGDGGAHLMTFHPVGDHSSSQFVHQEDWLDFNMIQSGHGRRNSPNYEFITRDRALTPTKPTLDGEANYEDHPVGWKPEELGWFDEVDVRQATYWGLLAGGCGITYGCHDIWQFLQPGREPVGFARTDWHTAIDLPASFQMGYARALYESRPFTLLAPDQSCIAETAPDSSTRVARAADGSFLFAYMPAGQPVTVTMSAISGEVVAAHWFNPRDGKWSPIGNFPHTGTHTFTPPSNGRGNDWVLVLDDAARKF